MRLKRPFLLTAICWYIIMKSIFNLIWFYLNVYLVIVSSPEILAEEIGNIPNIVWFGLIIFDIVINLWSATSMLSGKKQGRSIYLGYNILLFIVLVVSILIVLGEENLLVTFKVIAVLAISRVIYLGLLYFPSINRYFDRNRANFLGTISYFHRY